jgi:cysteinyl-tRNA synthetase
MALKIYNTLSKKVEVFKPIKKDEVLMFVCGVTVYDSAHIGHARSYIIFDTIARYLKYLGYKVKYVQNITDIDDKIIKRAAETNQDPMKLARTFEKDYLKNMVSLNVTSVSLYARASEHIKEIINQIQRLFDKGYAYEIEDGVYYDISKFKDYGKLSHQNIKELKKARIEPNPNKRNSGDFSLWKKQKPGEPAWDSPWGKGRPGWHIEDTAITEKHLGPQYDIHGGGQDLIFPHHEAEIAQIEAATGKKPLVKYWIHNAFLLVNGQKMSKSLGNFVSINDALEKWKPEVLRLFFNSVHYKIPIDYTEQSLEQAEKSYEKIIEFVRKLREIKKAKENIDVDNLIKNAQEGFEAGMNDDFNISVALAAIFEFIKKINTLIDKNEIGPKNAEKIYKLMLKFDSVLGLNLDKIKEKEKAPKEIMQMVEKREVARSKKDWKTADKIREEIKKKGWEVRDTKEGPEIIKIK